MNMHAVKDYLDTMAVRKADITRYGRHSAIRLLKVGDTYTLITYTIYPNNHGNTTIGGSVKSGMSKEKAEEYWQSWNSLNGGLAFGHAWKVGKSGATLGHYRDTRKVSGIAFIIENGGNDEAFYALSPQSKSAKMAAEFASARRIRK